MLSRSLPAPQLRIAADDALKNADVLIVGMTNDGKFCSSLQQIDAAGGGWITRLAERGKTPEKPGEILLLGTPPGAGPLW